MIKSFLFTGAVCLLAQIIKDNTKLTGGHITSLFVIIGAVLGFFGIYDKIVKCVGGGASVVIMSFGNTLYKTAVENGILNMLCGVSLGIVSAVVFSLVFTIISKPKD